MNNINYIRSLFNTNNPIWFMRQAGRYLPEYKKTRKQAPNFLELCYSPDLVTEITLQPIKRFGFDAAIIFSDILVLLDALGAKVNFIENKGPVIENVPNLKLIGKEKELLASNNIQNIYKAIKNVKKEISIPLIGFVGAPFTLACYLIDGGPSKNFYKTKAMAYNNPEEFAKVIELLTFYVALHAIEQIKSGADLIQIFDSWAGILNDENYYKWVILPTAKIVKKIKSFKANAPVTGFPKDSFHKYLDYINKTKIDIISFDSNASIIDIELKLPLDKVTQGNLDPVFLLADDKRTLQKEVNKIKNIFARRFHIFNLGHGILPESKIDNVNYIIELVRNN